MQLVMGKSGLLFCFLLMVCRAAYGQLPLPDVPSTLTRPLDRADFIAIHFYDAMDWSNKAMTEEENLMQDWANFLSVLPHCTPQMRDSAIVITIHSIPAPMIPTYADMADGYLFSPDSELYDETTYIKVLEALCSHPHIEPAYKSGMESRLEFLSKCAPGTRAVDITVEMLTGGATCRLYDLKGRAPNILVVFYDPDCDYCHETLFELSTDSHWTSLQQSGALIVVKAEITDETDSLYPILNVPSLYLLNGNDLTVVMRNILVEDIKL